MLTRQKILQGDIAGGSFTGYLDVSWCKGCVPGLCKGGKDICGPDVTNGAFVAGCASEEGCLCCPICDCSTDDNTCKAGLCTSDIDDRDIDQACCPSTDCEGELGERRLWKKEYKNRQTNPFNKYELVWQTAEHFWTPYTYGASGKPITDDSDPKDPDMQLGTLTLQKDGLQCNYNVTFPIGGTNKKLLQLGPLGANAKVSRG